MPTRHSFFPFYSKPDGSIPDCVTCLSDDGNKPCKIPQEGQNNKFTLDQTFGDKEGKYVYRVPADKVSTVTMTTEEQGDDGSIRELLSQRSRSSLLFLTGAFSMALCLFFSHFGSISASCSRQVQGNFLHGRWFTRVSVAEWK